MSTDGEAHAFPSLAGSTEMVVVVELDGGSSWQHAQLFRQGLKETEKSSLEITVEMEDAWNRWTEDTKHAQHWDAKTHAVLWGTAGL